ncbi:ATP-binding protein [Achromobacter mucicolens]|uniref:ATP-binding protein n=1 Tax=Achromobacter mucicolens TaxID=1389922 RepID=UPI0022F3B569|nr:ATP-binding protein [Achromobacter mucicolens]WBX88487.1 ATP-binding protein [Achromobacter mucicolens]
MAIRQISGKTEINGEGIKKHFRTTDPWRAIAELAWNGFDAKASNVEVCVDEGSMGGAVRAAVSDDGEGIQLETHTETFGRFNDSSKKEDVTMHGSHGRGRLSFHRLAERAIWWTNAAGSGPARIEVNGATLTNYEGRSVEPSAFLAGMDVGEPGTTVELLNLHTALPTAGELHNLLSVEFGWFLALNPAKRLRLNGSEVVVPSHDLIQRKLSVDDYEFDVSVLRWEQKPGSEKSYVYLLNSSGKTVDKKLSTFNHKGNFHTSIYVSSKWVDAFKPSGGDLASPDATGFESEIWRKVARELNKITKSVYEDFLRKQFEREIEGYVADGVFPTYAGLAEDYKKWRFENTKNILRAIYTADPTALKSLKKSQKKIVVRLLDKLAVSNENDAIFEVLNSVLELDDASTKLFAKQLKSVTLQSIVSAIEVLRHRHEVADKLRTLMNDHYLDTLETPDLQGIIEANTWLFGSSYETLGAEEDTFTKIAKSLRDAVKGINDIALDDLEANEATAIEGANKQTDLFLARKVPHHDSMGRKIYRCIVVEIKRPSIALNYKHLQQLDGYAQLIKKHAEFGSDAMHFELILIGRKISEADTEIRSRMQGQVAKGLSGLVSDDERMKRFVLNWYTLLDNFLLTNQAMIDALTLKRDSFPDSSGPELIADMQKRAA